jgi:O-antigen/teichoic acid export membrane protein
VQNFGKFPSDFADRIAAASYLSSEKLAFYNIVYDLVSRANILAQALASYYYPVIIKEPVQSRVLVNLTNGISALLTVVAFLGYYYGNVILGAYLGGRFADASLILAALTSIFALHTHNFASQTILRAHGRNKLLTLTQTLVAVVACTAMVPAFELFGLPGGLAIASVLRLPGTYLLLFVVEESTLHSRAITASTTILNCILIAYCCGGLL